VKNPAVVLALASVAVFSAGVYALDRYRSALSAREVQADLKQSLRKAVQLVAEHPRAFGAGAPPVSSEGSLKSLVQEAAASRSVTLAYLSESERETDKGRRERQVLARLLNSAHPNVVLFLQDLETRGGGAVVKEIHVRPSREIPDSYEEIEVVLSQSVAISGGKKP